MSHILILIVDDDPTIRDQYAEILQKRGYTVHQARNAKEGLDELTKTPPRLVILDELMPGSDGVTFLKWADIPHQHPETKVLVASNVDSPEVAQQLDKLKVDRYILKADYTPYRLADLVDKMLEPNQTP